MPMGKMIIPNIILPQLSTLPLIHSKSSIISIEKCKNHLFNIYNVRQSWFFKGNEIYTFWHGLEVETGKGNVALSSTALSHTSQNFIMHELHPPRDYKLILHYSSWIMHAIWIVLVITVQYLAGCRFFQARMRQHLSFLLFSLYLKCCSWYPTTKSSK